MKKDLFHSIIALANGEELTTSAKEDEKYRLLVEKTLKELDETLGLLSSEDISIRKRSIGTLTKKAYMNLMRNDASIAREWFMDEAIKEQLFQLIQNEEDQNCICAFIGLLSGICTRLTRGGWIFNTSHPQYLKEAYDLLISFLSHPSKAIQLESAYALTYFRNDEAWNVLYSMISKKPNAKVYKYTSNALSQYSRTVDKATIELFDKAGILYSKNGLPNDMATNFAKILSKYYGSTKNTEVKTKILDALRRIGNADNADVLIQYVDEEAEEYTYSKLLEIIILLKGKDATEFIKTKIKETKNEFRKAEIAEAYLHISSRADIPFFEEILSRLEVKHAISEIEHCISQIKKGRFGKDEE